MPDGIAMTVTRVARRLRVSQDTVRRWIHSGELPAVNLGGDAQGADWRVFEEHLDAFITNRIQHSEKEGSEDGSDEPC